MKNHNIIQIAKLFGAVVIVLVLFILVCKASYTLVSNSLVEKVRVDKTTVNYISFNYANDNEHIIEIIEPKLLSDFRGKRLLNNGYFDFEVSTFKESLKDDAVDYEIVVTDLGNLIEGEYVKFYLTNQDNDSMLGYDNSVPVYSVFPDTIDGKIIYTGKFSKKNLNDKFRLRIWVSNDYNKKVNSRLVYRVQVRIK